MFTPGYTRAVITATGLETFQVLLAHEDGRWVARILTLPNRIWVEPGGRAALKFHADTREQAESAAAAFIESERVSRGIRAAGPADMNAIATTPRLSFAPKPGVVRGEPPRPSPRLLHRLLVRFGDLRPELPGVTANLSESGLFIITSQPRPIGTEVEIDLRFAEIPLFLGGEVVWISPERRGGRSVGFGVRLVRKPGEYAEQLRALGLPLPSAS